MQHTCDITLPDQNPPLSALYKPVQIHDARCQPTQRYHHPRGSSLLLTYRSVHLDAAILVWRMPNEYQFGKALLQHKPEQGDGRIREMTKEDVRRISSLLLNRHDGWGAN